MAPALTRDRPAIEVAHLARRIGIGGPAILLLAICLAARAIVFGDPVVQIDEQFYLLVGGRMLHGALPYVDLWDRKPIGLFLLYALFHMVGRGVIAYHVGAMIAVWATAIILFSMARRVAPVPGALVAATLYVVWLNLAGGEAGQAPVFYNLFVAGAIAIVLGSARKATAGGDVRRPGLAAMFLFGIALQIKYSCLFEGLFAGLMLIALAWRGGRPLARLVLDAMLWAGTALLPTLLVILVYWRLGHLHEWWFANATSIFLRSSEAPDVVRGHILLMIALVAPLAACIPLRRWLRCRPADPADRDDLRILDGWAAAALLGVVLFGTWFNHYALPLFAPLAVTAAPLWNRRAGVALLIVLVAIGGALGERAIWHHQITRGNGRILDAAVAATRGRTDCLFVYDGLPALYDATGSCLPTNHPFSAHLQALNEAGATGIDEAGEVRRIMARRPQRVMTMEPAYDGENLASRAALYAQLGRGYRELFRYKGGAHQLVVYGRADTIPNFVEPMVIKGK
jgi:hypothetical protein